MFQNQEATPDNLKGNTQNSQISSMHIFGSRMTWSVA